MKTLYVMTPPSAASKILGVSEKMETLPSVFEPAEVYAVRCSESTIDEVRDLLSREHTAPKAMGVLRRQAHSFVFIGNV